MCCRHGAPRRIVSAEHAGATRVFNTWLFGKPEIALLRFGRPRRPRNPSKRWGSLTPPGAAGATQTTKIDDLQSSQNHVLKTLV
jgi:hypothetical protein